MLIYIAQWSDLERESEDIVDCDPWFDDGELVLRLTKKTAKGSKIMSIRLDEYQLQAIVNMAVEAGMIEDRNNATQS